MSKAMIFDIETVSPYDTDSFLPEHIEEYLNDMVDKRLKDKDKIKENKSKVLSNLALDPYVGKIFIIGTYVDIFKIYINRELLKSEIDTNFLKENVAINYYDNEAQLIETFIDDVNNIIANNGILISFNGKEFDLPYLFIRAIVNNIYHPIMNYLDLINRYNYSYHIDLYNLFDTKLKRLSLIFNIPSDNLSGDSIGEFYNKQDYISIINKNTDDLNAIKVLYDKSISWFQYKIKTVYSYKNADVY